MASRKRPGRSRPTIEDVAARAGVSTAAVSFAVNGRPGVAEATRRRILDAAEELGWRPSASARALTEARARAVGLLLSRSVDQLEIDPFFVRFLAGVERTLSRSDHDLVLRVAEHVDLAAYERLAGSGRVDGFLLCDVEVDDPRFALLAESGLPAVVAGHPVSPCPFPWIETEHAAGIRLVTEHLLALGHRRIAFAGGPAHLEHVQARLAAWRATLADAGVQPGPVAHADHAGLLGAGVTAIVHTSDGLAAATLAAARERGLSVPGDVAITGFDDSPLAALGSPPLTSVRVDYAGFGAGAAAALLAALAGEPVPAYRPAPPELVVRASTA
ncbi:MAG TPA: LacI family DNA-binding transcriptional regulator [Solirubrobacteraceae bacterium]|jgi:DNA-binding LacI/PurR family transcriptional regulator